MDINNLVVTGYLTKDPVSGEYKKDITNEETGEASEKKDRYVDFSIAINNGKYEPDFVDCKMYGISKCDAFMERANKGTYVLLEGKIKTDKYRVDGEMRNATYVLVDKFKTFAKSDKQQEKEG